MDNRLDAHFRDLPGWFGDRHPNLAGYHVIGDETAKFLAKQIRLRNILGSVPERWNISRRQGGTEDFRVLSVRRPAGPLRHGQLPDPDFARPDHQRLRSHRSLSLRARAKRDIWFWLTTGVKKLEENGENLYKLALSAQGDTENINWGTPPLAGQTYGPYGSYAFRNLPASRLTWPAQARARVEQDAAAIAPLGERWLTARYVLRKNSFQVWIDDRLLREAAGPDIDPFGMLKLTLFDGVQLGSVRVRPLPPDNNYESVRLDGYLNAANFAGDSLRRETLPAGGKDLAVQGVPFALPNADEKGRDHIDLQPSWLRGGLVEGPHDGWEGDTARWRSALHHDGGRIQFRVRNARYKALHLLAVFAGEPNTTPVVTAQFYRANAGHPLNFSARVTAFTAASKVSVPVQLAGGAQGQLHLVTIPLDAEGLDAFADQDHLEFELTKEVRVHRSYPDPIYYSQHGAGLPSGVHVFAVTLERPGVHVDWQPGRMNRLSTPDPPFAVEPQLLPAPFNPRPSQTGRPNGETPEIADRHQEPQTLEVQGYRRSGRAGEQVIVWIGGSGLDNGHHEGPCDRGRRASGNSVGELL